MLGHGGEMGEPVKGGHAVKTISRSQHLQLVGILTLAKRYRELMDDLTRAALSITKEGEECGHTNDAIWSDYTADELLERLHITVKDDA